MSKPTHAGKPGDKKGEKKKKGLLDSIWGPLGLLLIIVVIAICMYILNIFFDVTSDPIGD